MALAKHTFTADANTIYSENSGRWNGGVGHICAVGTFGSGTLKLQASPDGGANKVDLDSTNAQFTADGMGNFSLPQGYLLYIDLNGSTTPVLDVYIGTGLA